MSGKNTSVSLGEHWVSFIAGQVASGRFGSASEVVREGLRLLQERDGAMSRYRLIAERDRELLRVLEDGGRRVDEQKGG